MAKRTGGFIGQDGINAPDQATGVSASGGDEQVEVSFTSPTNVGGSAVTGYRVQSNDGIGASGSASPITVSGLTNGTSYTFNVWAINPFGWSSPSDASGGVTPAAARGVFGGGAISGSPYAQNVMQYITVKTTGNTVDFGNLTSIKSDQNYGSVASSTRGIFASTANHPPATQVNSIDYFTIASTGNASDFGDLPLTTSHGYSSLSSSTRGVFTAENSIFNGTMTMQYITIASTGNSSNFGSQHYGRGRAAGLASPTRGVTAGGYSSTGGGFTNSMEYLTIASTGNGTDFGDLTIARQQLMGLSTNTRGVFAGGNGSGGTKNTYDYITIASTGNATDFGDMNVAKSVAGATSDPTRGVVGGGSTTNEVPMDSIEYITVASTGNGTDFGDLLVAARTISATSNGHGGLS
jgi:hypothetical protein